MQHPTPPPQVSPTHSSIRSINPFTHPKATGLILNHTDSKFFWVAEVVWMRPVVGKAVGLVRWLIGGRGQVGGWMGTSVVFGNEGSCCVGGGGSGIPKRRDVAKDEDNSLLFFL